MIKNTIVFKRCKETTYQDFKRLLLLGLAQPKNAVYFIFCDGHGYDVYGDLAHFLFHAFLRILSVCIFYARHFRYRCHFDAFVFVFCHHYNFGQLEILANHAYKRRTKIDHFYLTNNSNLTFTQKTHTFDLGFLN